MLADTFRHSCRCIPVFPMTDGVTPASSALALREAFGDRKPPDISRKITACVACRKLKVIPYHSVLSMHGPTFVV